MARAARINRIEFTETLKTISSLSMEMHFRACKIREVMFLKLWEIVNNLIFDTVFQLIIYIRSSLNNVKNRIK